MHHYLDHATYLSPDIQNQMIEVIGSAISKEIIRRVKEATFFAIIADETPDSGKIEQLSLLVRYVRNGTIEERLLSVEPMDQTTAEALLHTIRDKLENCGIAISNLRGQCYDGASNVSGIYTGLQARVKELSSSALYTHCYAHVLNLVIVDTMTKNKTARDFFGTLQNLYVFIETCTKRHALYTKNQTQRNKKDKDGKQREYFLKKLSDTRWACRADSIKAIHHTLEAVLDTLEDIKDNETKANIAAEAKGLFNNIDFEFVLALEVKYVENAFKL